VHITRRATPGVLRKFAPLGIWNVVGSSKIGFSFVARIAFSVNEVTRDVRVVEVVITRDTTPGVLRKFVSLGFRNAESSLNIGFSFVARIAFSVNEATRDVRVVEVVITRQATHGVLRKFVSLGFRNAVSNLNIGFSFVTRITFSASEATRHVRTFEVPITRTATPGVLWKFVSLGFRNVVSSLNIGFSFVTRITFSVNEATRDVRVVEVVITRRATPGVLRKFVSLGFRNAAGSSKIGFSFVA